MREILTGVVPPPYEELQNFYSALQRFERKAEDSPASVLKGKQGPNERKERESRLRVEKVATPKGKEESAASILFSDPPSSSSLSEGYHLSSSFPHSPSAYSHHFSTGELTRKVSGQHLRRSSPSHSMRISAENSSFS